MTLRPKTKIAKELFLNSLPQALRGKISDEKLLKLCTKRDYRVRQKNKRCPKCNSRDILYRSRTHDLRCVECKHIFSKPRQIMGGVRLISSGKVPNGETGDVLYDRD